jgi:hypothetical protein
VREPLLGRMVRIEEASNVPASEVTFSTKCAHFINGILVFSSAVPVVREKR